MSLGSLTLLISRECDTYYKTRIKKIHRVDALRFPHFDCLVKERGRLRARAISVALPASASLITRAELLNHRKGAGGANRDRTDDLLLAKQALSQLSYGPINGGSGWS